MNHGKQGLYLKGQQFLGKQQLALFVYIQDTLLMPAGTRTIQNTSVESEGASRIITLLCMEAKIQV